MKSTLEISRVEVGPKCDNLSSEESSAWAKCDNLAHIEVYADTKCDKMVFGNKSEDARKFNLKNPNGALFEMKNPSENQILEKVWPPENVEPPANAKLRKFGDIALFVKNQPPKSH